MTDKEIIKALECLQGEGDSCTECAYHKKYRFGVCRKQVAKDALDLINRQQAEIERLTINMNAFGLGMKREKERADTIRAEAIKEFAERLKDDSWFTDLFDRNDYPVRAVTKEDIDNLVKEMVGK